MSAAIRSLAGPTVAFATVHVVVVGWAAWFLMEAAWSTAPLSASPTPLVPATFTVAWLAGMVVLALAGPAIGGAALRGGWVGLDPTRVLARSARTRVVTAWGTACVLLAIVEAAPAPLYLALLDLGAFAPSEAGWPLLMQTTLAAAAGLIGVLLAFGAEPRSGGPR